MVAAVGARSSARLSLATNSVIALTSGVSSVVSKQLLHSNCHTKLARCWRCTIIIGHHISPKRTSLGLGGSRGFLDNLLDWSHGNSL